MELMEPYQTLTESILKADKGIQVVPLSTDWGVTLIFMRCNKHLPWRVTINHAGQSGIFKPQTATIPQINMHFEAGDYKSLTEHVTHFIERGWI